MIDTCVSLSLQAAVVAASAIRQLQGLGPHYGTPNGELTGFQDALDSLLCFYRPPRPKPVVVRVPKPRRTPRPKKVIRRRPPPLVEPALQEENQTSEWDPEPLYEASRCQALLIEIIRRAAHDYVLYRQHHRIELRVLAENAYIWLFVEEPGHPAWRARERSLSHVKDAVGTNTVEVGSLRLTSFLSICEACGLDPETVRDRARKMTVDEIMRAGRHIERRPSRASQDAMSLETHSVVDIDIDLLDHENSSSSSDYYDSRDSYSVDHSW